MTGKTSSERQAEYAARVREDKEDLKALYGILHEYRSDFGRKLTPEQITFIKRLEVKMSGARFK